MSAVVYPTYAEYVDFCLGFMTPDLPWLNNLIPENSLSNIDDDMPLGYRFYFHNMNMASMHLFTVILFIAIIFFGYCLLIDSRPKELRLKDQKSTLDNYKFKAFR